MEPNILCDENDIEGDQDECPWLDDVTYEDLDNDQRVSDNGSVVPGQSHAEVTLDMGHALTEHGISINGHKVDSLHGTGSLAPYLDWALIEFDNGYFERPNAFYSEEDPAYPKFLAKLSAAPKTSVVPVFMISGVSGTRRGLMLNHNSYIGGKPGENLCQAWNVILSNSARVIDGDCGSLVVNQETLEVYGHVVASNPLGEAYVVPLQNTFHQISGALGSKELSLPSPGLLMANLITHYSEAGKGDVANAAKLILDSMAVENQFYVEKQDTTAPQSGNCAAGSVASSTPQKMTQYSQPHRSARDLTLEIQEDPTEDSSSRITSEQQGRTLARQIPGSSGHASRPVFGTPPGDYKGHSTFKSLQMPHNHSASFDQGSNKRHISQQNLDYGLDTTGRTTALGGTAASRNLSDDSCHSGFSASSASSATTMSYGDQSQAFDYKPTFHIFDGEELTQPLYEEIYQPTKLRLQSNHYESDVKHTPSSLGWPIPATEHLKYYNFKVPKGKQPYLELAQSWEAPPDMPRKVYLDSSDSEKGICPCKYPNGCCMSFKRSADLDRHYTNVHAFNDQKLRFNCDYSKCSRSNDPFNRKDHYRDHLQDYHREDIGTAKQAKGITVKEWEKAQKKWIEERQITAQWWRCTRCLVRVKDSWDCYQCKQTCETERIKIREKIAQNSTHQKQMNEEPPTINYRNDYEQKSSLHVACATCTSVGYLQNTDGITWAPCYACNSEANESAASSYYHYDASYSNC